MHGKGCAHLPSINKDVAFTHVAHSEASLRVHPQVGLQRISLAQLPGKPSLPCS